MLACRQFAGLILTLTDRSVCIERAMSVLRASTRKVHHWQQSRSDAGDVAVRPARSLTVATLQVEKAKL